MSENQRTRRKSPLAVRLTLVSTAAFALAAAVLLIAEYAMLQYVVEVSVDATTGSSSDGEFPGELDGSTTVFRVARDLANTVMLFSIITAVIMVALAGTAVWLVARRSLGRVATVTDLTKRITGENLAERLELTGPRDEIRDLGDTIDDMLQRLFTAFEQQDRFVANASHELRTPLAGIRASLEASLLHDDVAERAEIAMHRALEATGRSEELLTALLQLARSRRLSAEQLQTLDLAETTAAVIELLQSEIDEAGQALDVTLQDVEVHGDTVLVMQAAHNLVHNAIRHGDNASPIEIRVFSEAGEAVLRVSNAGAVLDEFTIDKLIEPFNRGNRTRQSDTRPGTGLGLSIVQSIAAQHHGSLDVAARPGGGLVAQLRLPLLSDVARGHTDAPPIDVTVSGASVLLPVVPEENLAAARESLVRISPLSH